MGKYKKYAKTEQNFDQTNKNSQNYSNTNSFIQGKKIVNKKREINNKNESFNQRNRNYAKIEKSSLSVILLEIFDAMKYFFIMCKNFIIPEGISFKIFTSFLILEILYQGIIIYLIKSVLFTLNKYFSIWTKITNMYIFLISYIQMIHIFLCEGLLIFRFIHFKIYLYKKCNWFINFSTSIIIFFNAVAVKELNSNVYRFHAKNNDIHLYNNENIKNYLVNEYINLYVNKNYDFNYYEFCYEMKFNKIIFDKIKNNIPSFHWFYDSNLNLYVGCRNFSFSNNQKNEQKQILSFFNCQNKLDVNTAPDFCVSSKFRQERFYSHLKIAVIEVIILILWNLYNYFSIELIYHYFPCLKNSNQNNTYQKNSSKINNYNYYKYNEYQYNKVNYQNNNINQTVTYKDINDKEIYDREFFEEEEEEEEYEEEEEEEEEENYKKNEGYKKEHIREFKMWKISKKKMKAYKKKRKKNRYKEEKYKNKNEYFDDEILNKDYFDNNDNDDDSSEKNDDDEDDDFIKLNKNKFESYKETNELNNKKEDFTETEGFEEEKEEEEQMDMHSYIYKANRLDDFNRKNFENFKHYQYIHKLFNFLFGKYINMIKHKYFQLLIEMDKDLSDDDN